jgi:hypothetical protein
MIAIMNIQQYMTPEIVGPLSFISILFVALLSSIQINKLSKLTEHYEEESDIAVCESPHVSRPQAGQIWHKKAFDEDVDYIPWIESDPERAESFKILEIRYDSFRGYDYIKAKNLKTEHLYYFTAGDLMMEYMQDDFGDYKKLQTPEEPEVSKDVRLEDMGFNVVKIHGEDFVLKPLGK